MATRTGVAPRSRGPRRGPPPRAGAARPHPRRAARRRRRGPAAILLRLVALLAALAVAYLVLTFAGVWWTATTDRAESADAIIVLGAAQYQGRPSPVFAARLDHAAELYRRGVAPVVVVTGGRQDGDAVTEARTADVYLQARGVPDTALRLETTSRTTYENIAASARILRDGQVGDEVVIVSDGWHLARAAATAADVGLVARTSPAPGSPYSTGAALQQMVRETGGVAVGRLIGFRRLDNLSADAVGGLGGTTTR